MQRPSVEHFEEAIAEIFERTLDECGSEYLCIDNLPCEMYERYPDESVKALDEALVRFLRKGAPWENFKELSTLDTAMIKSFPFFLKCKRYFVLMGLYVDELHRRSCSVEIYLWYRLAIVCSGNVPHPLDALLPELCVERVRLFSRCKQHCERFQAHNS